MTEKKMLPMKKKRIKKYGDALQSNSITESAYTLTLQQKRVIMLGIFKSKIDGSAQFSVAEFCDFFGVRKNNAKMYIVQERDNLISANILIENPDGGVTVVNWVESLTISPKGDFIELQFSSFITRELSALQERFTVFSILEVGKMKNLFVIRIYMLLCQWRSVGKYTVKVAKLHHMLQTDGKHAIFANFKARVLKPAFMEINNKTNFNMHFEEIKKGNKVDELVFFIKEKIPSFEPDLSD